MRRNGMLEDIWKEVVFRMTLNQALSINVGEIMLDITTINSLMNGIIAKHFAVNIFVLR